MTLIEKLENILSLPMNESTLRTRIKQAIAEETAEVEEEEEVEVAPDNEYELEGMDEDEA